MEKRDRQARGSPDVSQARNRGNKKTLVGRLYPFRVAEGPSLVLSMGSRLTNLRCLEGREGKRIERSSLKESKTDLTGCINIHYWFIA